jgi:hypothetical protein
MSDVCSGVAGTWNWSYSQFCNTSTSLEIQSKHLEPNAKGEGCTKVKGPFRITQKLQDWIGLLENPQGGVASYKHGLVALNECYLRKNMGSLANKNTIENR